MHVYYHMSLMVQQFLAGIHIQSFLQAVKLEQRRQSRVVASFQAGTMVEVLICSPVVIKHG